MAAERQQYEAVNHYIDFFFLVGSYLRDILYVHSGGIFCLFVCLFWRDVEVGLICCSLGLHIHIELSSGETLSETWTLTLSLPADNMEPLTLSD